MISEKVKQEKKIEQHSVCNTLFVNELVRFESSSMFVRPCLSHLRHVQEHMVGTIVKRAVELEEISVLGPSLAQSLHTDDDPGSKDPRYILLLYPGTCHPPTHPPTHPPIHPSTHPPIHPCTQLVNTQRVGSLSGVSRAIR